MEIINKEFKEQIKYTKLFTYVHSLFADYQKSFLEKVSYKNEPLVYTYYRELSLNTENSVIFEKLQTEQKETMRYLSIKSDWLVNKEQFVNLMPDFIIREIYNDEPNKEYTKYRCPVFVRTLNKLHVGKML